MLLLFKISGLAIVFSVCALSGFSKSSNIKKRSHRLDNIYRSLTLLGERIKADGGEISVILPLCFGDDFVHIEKNKISFNKAFLENTDIDVLTEFFAELGFGDKHSEYERTCLYTALIKKQADEAEEKARSLCKLYNTLGILVGVFVCIFFL